MSNRTNGRLPEWYEKILEECLMEYNIHWTYKIKYGNDSFAYFDYDSQKHTSTTKFDIYENKFISLDPKVGIEVNEVLTKKLRAMKLDII